MSVNSDHISKISNAIESWLNPENLQLMEAIERTVDEGLFSIEDIKFQIRTLKQTLRKDNLKRWSRISGLNSGSLSGKRILCLHAGNLPLVGLQDLLSVMMTGGDYIGKLSKKDPYLLPTLLSKFEDYKLTDGSRWNTNLNILSGSKTDAVLFAGSEKSVSRVEEKLYQLNLSDKSTPKLIRTAHFSIAFIRDNKRETMQDLTEAVFRYGGTGCRSVAIVVAPFHLNAEKCTFTDYIEAFWIRNPQFQKPPEALEYRFAFNKAVDIPQAWLNDFLIEENVEHPNEKFILYWIKGDYKTLDDIVRKFKYGLQSVYSTDEMIGKEVDGLLIEPLSESQKPPIWWKPDGIDTISWLQALNFG